MRKSGLIALGLLILGTTGCVLALGNRVEPDQINGKGDVVSVRANKDLELKQNGGALILRTDSGKRFSVKAGEDGQLVVTPL